MALDARCLMVSKMFGSKVYNHSGEALGKIIEVVIAPNKQAIAFVIMSFSYWAGFKNKLFAVPYSALQYAVKQQGFLLNINKHQLKVAAGFDAKHWPNMDDPVWTESVEAFFGKPGLL